jgi:hypothetical protein
MTNAIRLLALGALLFVCQAGRSEELPAAAPAPENGKRVVLILPSTDTSPLNLGVPLQYGLGQLFQTIPEFETKLSSFTIGGYTEYDLKKAYAAMGNQILTFVYMEKERLSIFFFDPTQPKYFIVASNPLQDPNDPSKAPDNAIAEAAMKKTFDEVITLLRTNQWQLLPGASADTESLAVEEEKEMRRRAEEARAIFRELNAVQEKFWYFGTNFGMSRFTGGGSAASTINLGILGGIRPGDRMRVELGFDFFSYALGHLDGRYTLPIAEKYVTLSVSLGIGFVLAPLTANRGANDASLTSGSILFGPGVGFEIPLLGANIRGELRYYLGGGTVLLGTYGIVLSI